MNKEFKFYTNNLSYNVESKSGEPEYFVTGYITTGDKDIVNDIVTQQCMEDMIVQLKSGNIKLDIEHEAFRQDGSPNKIPVGKIIDARLESKGIWVKAAINQFSPAFKSAWGSIKKGFIDAFSITYKAIDYVNRIVSGVECRLLNKINLLNVALTGNPINPNATIEKVFMKSIRENMEENKMTDVEVKGKKADDSDKEEMDKKAAKEEEEDKKCSKKSDDSDEDDKEETKKKSVNKKGNGWEDDEDEEEEKASKKAKAEVKSDIESLRKDLAEMKALLMRPEFKSVMPKEQTPDPVTKIERKAVNVSPLDACSYI